MADFVGKIENLPQDLIRMLRLAGEQFDEGKLVSTPRVNESALQPHFPRELQQAVLKAERKVLEQFDYEGPCHGISE